MSTFQSNTSDLATRIKGDIVTLHGAINGSPTTAGEDTSMIDLSGLNTSAKTNLVAAINEILANVSALVDDSGTGADDLWSASQIISFVGMQISNLVNGAGSALDTLQELSAALGNDANFATTVSDQLATKATIDTTFTRTELGDPTTDFVAVYDAA